MPRAKPNGTSNEIVRHLTTRCGIPIDVAQKAVPQQKNIEQSPRTALDPDALDTYLRLVRSEYADDPVLRAVLLLLPVTGLRVSEICSLSSKNLVREGDRVSWKFRGKGDKERTVPLWKKARRVFDPYMADERPKSVYLFPNLSRKGHILPATVQDACRHLASLDPSLKHLTPHVLRHTFATTALLHCHDLNRVQTILGHGRKGSIKIPVVMLRYLHPKVSENRSKGEHSKFRRPLAARANPVHVPSQRLESNMSDDWYWKQRYYTGTFGVEEPWTHGLQPTSRRNPRRKARKNESELYDHSVYEQIIAPFSVTEERTQGLQPVNRRNPRRRNPNELMDFEESLRGHISKAFDEGHRALRVRHAQTATFVNFYNLPESVIAKRAGGGAEAENNRMMFTITKTADGKVQVEHTVNALDRAHRLRGKTGSPSVVGKYVAEHLNKVAREVPPNLTHSRENPRRRKAKKNLDVYKQVMGPFGVSEKRIGGIQPVNRRNPKSSDQAKRAMKLYHSGKAPSLKAAWAKVKKGK